MNAQSPTRRLFDSLLLPYVLVISGALVLGSLIGRQQWLYFAPFAVLAALALAVRWPVVMSLGIYVFLVPFQWILDYRLFWFVAAATGVIILALGIVNRRLRCPPRQVFSWALFVLWACATTLWAPDHDEAVKLARMLLYLFLLYVVTSSLHFEKKEIDAVITLTIIGGVGASIYILADYHLGGAYAAHTGRATLELGEIAVNPNRVATALLLPFSFSLSRIFVSSTPLRRALSAMAGAVITFGVLYTMSRGAVLAFAVIVVVYILRLRLNWRIILAVAVLVAAFWVVPQSFYTRFGRAMSSGGSGRTEIWRQGLLALHTYGLIGMGLGNSPIRYRVGKGVMSDPHNLYLGVWLETGVVGLSLLGLAVTSHIRRIERMRRLSRGMTRIRFVSIEAACFGVLVSGMFLRCLWQRDFWLLWMIIIMFPQIQQWPNESAP